MTCLTSPDGKLTICTPTVLKTRRRILYCPKCKRRRRVEVRSYEWYPPDAVCKAPRRRWKHVVEPCGYRWQWE